MAQIDGAGQQDADNEDAEALQAALAQRQVTLQGQPQGGSDVPIHQNSDPVIRRIGNSTVPSASYRKTSCTVCAPTRARPSACEAPGTFRACRSSRRCAPTPPSTLASCGRSCSSSCGARGSPDMWPGPPSGS